MMHRHCSLLSLTLCGLSGLLPGQRNIDLQHEAQEVEPLSQAAINDAIRAGVTYLKETQQEDHWLYKRAPFSRRPGARIGGDDYSGGLTALALYALASSGVAAKELEMQKGLEWCREHPQPFASGRRATYSASLLVLALTRIDPVKHQKWIHKLAGRIANSQLKNGMWTYELRVRGKKPAKDNDKQEQRWPWQNSGDGSNTQFAVLALWSAQLTAKFRVPPGVWQKVRALHERTQHENGGWSYKEPRQRNKSKKARFGPQAPVWMREPSPAMTAAGTFAYACSTAALNGGARGLPRARKTKIAQRGLAAFRAHRAEWDTLLEDYYFAYSVERVGTLFELPEKEWYTDLARRLVARQAKDGRWGRKWRRGMIAYGDDRQVYETSLALLCLKKATSHPITPRK